MSGTPDAAAQDSPLTWAARLENDSRIVPNVTYLTASNRQSPMPAIDITAAEVQAFLKALPRDAVSDQPIRVVDVGGYKVGKVQPKRQGTRR